MLVVMGLLAVLAISEMLFHSLRIDHRARYERVRQELVLLRSSQDLLKQVALEKSGQERSRDSLLSLTNRSLQKHELRSSALTPNSDGSMTLSFDATEYVQLMAWLHTIEQQGHRTVDIGIVQTDVPGLLTARLTLSQ